VSFWDVEALSASLRRSLDRDVTPIGATHAVTWIALSVRQLASTGRLSGGLQRQSWPVKLHWPLSGARPGATEGHLYADFYALGGSRSSSLTTMRMCGMLIHSLVLDPVEGADGVECVRFTTMLTRDEGLYAVDWSTLEELVHATCREIVPASRAHAQAVG
jgi:hypothetical protein